MGMPELSGWVHTELAATAAKTASANTCTSTVSTNGPVVETLPGCAMECAERTLCADLECNLQQYETGEVPERCIVITSNRTGLADR